MLFLAVQRALFGESLFALRLLPALAGASTVLVAGLIERLETKPGRSGRRT